MVIPRVTRNPELIKGIRRYSKSKMYHRRGLSAIKKQNDGAFPDHEGKPAERKPEEKPPKFYPADDVKKPLKNKRKHKPTRLRFQSSMFWVYGEESCVLKATSVWSPSRHLEKQKFPQEKKDDQKTVDVALIKLIESVPNLKAYLGARFSLKDGMKPHELEKQKFPQEKKDDQKIVDAALIKLVESVPDLNTYLGARFSIKYGMKPHKLVF
ncbi:hypothetical protein Dimus_012824 [Dionaea muscipula]